MEYRGEHRTKTDFDAFDHSPVIEYKPRTGSEAMCEALLDEGVEHLFGYPGGAIMPFYDALPDYPLKHVLTRHEQAAAHAADGYARATGRVGVCVATSGPGATNLVTGLATAQMDSVPLVAITGQVGRPAMGKDSFQETDVMGMTLPFTKHSFLVEDPEEFIRRCGGRLRSQGAAGRVPATSANLGPGFDAVGLALSLSMRISLDRAPEPVVEVHGEGSELIPADPEHPAYRAAKFVAEFIGEPDINFHLIQENSIPPARGLGGSAAALVGGAVAANDLLGRAMAPPDLLNLVCDLDGHPDNAAPALLGGLIIGTLTPDGIKSVRLEPAGLGAAVVVPDFTVSTTSARRALPEHVPHRDAVFNVGRAGLLLGALSTGDYELLRVAMQDKLHQPYRAHLIPGLDDVIEAALSSGAYGACLSGSGPTVLAFTPEEESEKVSAAMRRAFEDRSVEAKAWALSVDLAGARVEPPGEVPTRRPVPVL